MMRAAPFWLAIAAMVLVAALAALAAPRALATEATPAQIAACAPDALRLCAARLADGHDAIKACMLAHRAELSPACREAFRK